MLKFKSLFYENKKLDLKRKTLENRGNTRIKKSHRMKSFYNFEGFEFSILSLKGFFLIAKQNTETFCWTQLNTFLFSLMNQ
jgi:hypothetical protein